MSLATTVKTGDPDHAGLHNDERSAINALQSDNAPSARDFGAKALGGSVDDTTALQRLLDTGEPAVKINAGTYTLDQSADLILRYSMRIFGEGRRRSLIQSWDGCGLKGIETGSLDVVHIHDLGFALKMSSVSGSAIRTLANAYRAGWIIERCEAMGSLLSPDPLYDLGGYINSAAYACFAGAAQIGFRISNNGLNAFPSNGATLRDCAATACTVVGMRVNGGDSVIIGNPRLEDCRHGVELMTNRSQVLNGRYEHDYGADIVIGGSNNIAHRNLMFYHDASSTEPNILFAPQYNAELWHHNDIAYNSNPDGSGARDHGDPNDPGLLLDIPTYAEGTRATFNDGSVGGWIRDAGTGTLRFGNGDGIDTLPRRILKATSQAYYPAVALPTMRIQAIPNQTEPLLQFEDANGAVLAHVDASGQYVKP